MKEKVLLSWSGGKDSALALYEFAKGESYQTVALVTTITEEYGRISMHGVRRTLLEQQAESLGLPVEQVLVSRETSDEEYASKMEDVLTKYLATGVYRVAFGDIFLEDLRKHREANLSQIGMKGVFPLWQRGTRELAHKFIDLRFKAVIACVDSNVLEKTFTGRNFDEQFLRELPPSVDPCGENGEFHAFVYDGPLLRKKISHTKGEVVLRENGFYYCDLTALEI